MKTSPSPSLPLQPSTTSAHISIVVSEFNHAITTALLTGAQERLHELSAKEAHVVWVPGAVEIPLMAQHLAKAERYDAIVALGAVIRGETTHYDYVCQQVSHGCQKVALKYHLPVIFGVLTTENELQAWERVTGKQGHKGRDAVDTAFRMIHLLGQPL